MHVMRLTARRASIATAMLAGILALPGVAAADGALAVGEPRDVVAEGFAYGFALDEPTPETASAKAVTDCKAPTAGIDPRAQALCRVVQTFKNQCFAVALDPQDGTPGVGWAVADDTESARRAALAKCVATAGDDRRDFCEINHSGCDGSTK